MLSSFRGLLKGAGAYVLVALVIIVFAFVGVPALDNFGANEGVKVGEATFSVNEIEREFTRRIAGRQAQEGEVLSRQEAVSAGLLTETLSYFTMRGIVDQEARVLGLDAPTSMIRTELQTRDVFANPETGVYDPERVERILQANGLTIGEFRERMRIEMLQLQLDSGLAVITPAPQMLADLLLLRQTEERTVTTAVITPDDVPAPSEDDLRSWYAGNIGNYETPEYRSWNMVILSADTVSARVDVTEDEIRQAFEARKSQMTTPPRRSFVQAQFDDITAAEDAIAATSDGVPFEEAARARGGLITEFREETRDAIADPTVAEAIFGQSEPGIVGPVDGLFGVVVADVSAITDGAEPTFEEARDDLAAALREEYVGDEIYALYEQFQQSGDQGAGLSEAARDLGFEVRQVGPVSFDLTTQDGTPVGNIPDQVRRAAFSTAAGDLFAEVELPGGDTAFVEVTETLAASARPFETVADQVAADYAAEKRGEAIASAVDRLRLAVAGGESFSNAVSAVGSEARTLVITQGNPESSVSRELLDAIFNAEIGTVVSVYAPDGSNAEVAVTDTLKFGPNSQAQDFSGVIRSRIGEAMSREYYDAYLRAAQDEIGVSVNEAALSSRLGLEP